MNWKRKRSGTRRCYVVESEETTEEKLDRLVEFIEKEDFWVTTAQCAKVYGCMMSTIPRIMGNLRRMKRLPPSFQVVPIHRKGILSRNFRHIGRLIRLESKDTPFEEMSKKLKISLEELRSIRYSLFRLGHPKYLKAIKKKKELKRLERQNRIKYLSGRNDRLIERFDSELMVETGMRLDELNAYNAVNLFTNFFMKFVNDGEFGRLKDINKKIINKDDIKYLKRYGLITTVPNRVKGGKRLKLTLKAMGLLFLQGHVHPRPMRPYIITDEAPDAVLVTVSPESES